MNSLFTTTAFAILSTLALNSGFCADINEQIPNPKDVRIVPVDPTPEPDHVVTKILFPQNGEVKSSGTVKGQIRVDGFSLGTTATFPEKKRSTTTMKGRPCIFLSTINPTLQ